MFAVGWSKIQLDRLHKLGLEWQFNKGSGWDEDDPYISVRGGDVVYHINRPFIGRHVQVQTTPGSKPREIGQFWSIYGARRAIGKHFTALQEQLIQSQPI